MPASSPAWQPHTAAQTAYPVKRNRRSPIVPSVSPRTWSTQLYSEGPWYSTIAQFYERFTTSYLTCSGVPPFGQRAWSAPGPAIDQGAPRAPSNNLRNKTTCNSLEVTQHQNTWARENPFRPPEQNPVQSVSRQGRPEPYQTNSTRHYASGFNHTRKLHFKTLQTSSTKQFLRTEISPRPIRSLGEGMSSNGVTMAQSPGETSTPEAYAYYNNYTTSPFPRENYQGSDTYVVGACHLLWPYVLRALCDLGRWLGSPGWQRGYGLAQRDSSNS